MKRFGDGDFFSDDDHNFDYEDEFTDDQEHVMSGAIPTDLIQQWKRSEINLEEQKINFVVLQQTISVLEKSWFWRFKSASKRVQLISSTYHALIDLVFAGDS